MNLFDEIASAKDQSEIESLDNQIVTNILFFTMEEKEEYKKLVKLAIQDLIPDVDKDRKNESDGLLMLLRKHYGES